MKYPAGVHLSQARTSLLTLLVKDGTAKLASYKASSASAEPAYADLKDARERSDQALELAATDEPANKSHDEVRVQLKTLCDTASAKLQAFQTATSAHDQGYALLVSARDLSNQVSIIDSKYPPGVALATAVAPETGALDKVVDNANSQIASPIRRSLYHDQQICLVRRRRSAVEADRSRGLQVSPG